MRCAAREPTGCARARGRDLILPIRARTWSRCSVRPPSSCTRPPYLRSVQGTTRSPGARRRRLACSALVAGKCDLLSDQLTVVVPRLNDNQADSTLFRQTDLLRGFGVVL